MPEPQESVRLHHTELGGPDSPDAPQIVILHGLFGSSRNWTGAGRALTDVARVYALDLRNHGDSPHADSHSLADLRDDVRRWIRERGLKRPILLGHSMGGMAAMDFAASYPDDLQALIVVDIAPRRYEPHHHKEFAALQLDVAECESRQDADRMMQSVLDDAAVRQFLQMNLERLPEGGYRWKVNVPVLRSAAENAEYLAPWFADEAGPVYSGPALFIYGEASDYVQGSDRARIPELFPQAQLVGLSGQGHWLHYSAQDDFTAAVRKFLSGRLKR